MTAPHISRPSLDLDEPFLERLGGPPSSLVFIMGSHRSGTSFLYHLLAYTRRFDYVTPYDIVNYRALLFNRLNEREGELRETLDAYLKTLDNRGLDQLRVGADTPEEYRYILNGDIAPISSPKGAIDEIFKPHLTEESHPRFLELCRKKRYLASDDRPLLLKTPNDFYFNFLQVLRLCPQSKFIFIHRHPLLVLNSFQQSFKSLFVKRSEYPALIDKRYGRLFETRQVRRLLLLVLVRSDWFVRTVLGRLVDSFAYYLANVGSIPGEQYTAIRYEDLCRQPDQRIKEIGNALGLGLTPETPPNFVQPRSMAIGQKILKNYQARLEDIRPYLTHLGYPDFPSLNAAVNPDRDGDGSSASLA